MDSKEIIQQLNLTRHPEGGYYREVYRSKEKIQRENGTMKNAGTSIYYLLENDDKSHFHRVASDELWFFHQGEPLILFFITKEGNFETITLGNNLVIGELPQYVISAGSWFGAFLKNGNGFSLMSCVVTPGFDFSDFELAKKEELLQIYPHLRTEIELYCL